jgi:lysophospholipase L1-like esterase
VSLSEIRQALHVLGPNRVLGLVTPRELGGSSGSDATHMRQAAARYGKHVVLLDWVKYSRGHGSWFQPDGTHLTFAGAQAFARLFRTALPRAVGPPFH